MTFLSRVFYCQLRLSFPPVPNGVKKAEVVIMTLQALFPKVPMVPGEELA